MNVNDAPLNKPLEAGTGIVVTNFTCGEDIIFAQIFESGKYDEYKVQKEKNGFFSIPFGHSSSKSLVCDTGEGYNVLKLKAGKYFISNIFVEFPKANMIVLPTGGFLTVTEGEGGDFIPSEQNSLKFEVLENQITYIGDINIRRKNLDGKFHLSPDSKLVTKDNLISDNPAGLKEFLQKDKTYSGQPILSNLAKL